MTATANVFGLRCLELCAFFLFLLLLLLFDISHFILIRVVVVSFFLSSSSSNSICMFGTSAQIWLFGFGVFVCVLPSVLWAAHGNWCAKNNETQKQTHCRSAWCVWMVDFCFGIRKTTVAPNLGLVVHFNFRCIFALVHFSDAEMREKKTVIEVQHTVAADAAANLDDENAELLFINNPYKNMSLYTTHL